VKRKALSKAKFYLGMCNECRVWENRLIRVTKGDGCALCVLRLPTRYVEVIAEAIYPEYNTYLVKKITYA
jgi:hypothetical protein